MRSEEPIWRHIPFFVGATSVEGCGLSGFFLDVQLRLVQVELAAPAKARDGGHFVAFGHHHFTVVYQTTLLLGNLLEE